MKKRLTNSNFISGVDKLSKSILKAITPDENGKIHPIIDIPPEFNPTFPVVMSSIDTVVENIDIYGLFMNDMSIQAKSFEQEKGYLIGAIKDEETTKKEMIDLLQKDTIRINVVLCCELYKEIMDAFFYVAYEFANSLAAELDMPVEIRNDFFRSLTDFDEKYKFDRSVRMTIADNINTSKSAFCNDYAIFNYVVYMKDILAAEISDIWYNSCRDLIYYSHPIEVSETYNIANTVCTTYLVVIREVLTIILMNFQPKISFCYSNSRDLLRSIEDGSIYESDEEESKK